jgi:hypothetical protein
MSVARCHITLGDAAASVPFLERAVDLRTRRGGAPAELADAQFTQARALWHTRQDRKRALDLAEQARANYQAADASQADDLADVEAWLRKRGR